MILCFAIIIFSCMPNFHCKYFLWLNCWSVVLSQKYKVFKTFWILTSSLGHSFFPSTFLLKHCGSFYWPLDVQSLHPVMDIVQSFYLLFPKLPVRILILLHFLARCVEGKLKWVSHIKWWMADTLNFAKVVLGF